MHGTDWEKVVRRPSYILFCAALLLAFALRPVAAAEDQSVQVPTALIELDGTGSENPDGGELTFRWSQLEGPKVELSDPTAPKPYFRTSKPGLYRFELVVSANGLDSEPFIVEIMIEKDNQPPVAQAPKEVQGEVGRRLEIDGRDSYDPEGEQLTYRWYSRTPGFEIPPEVQGRPVLIFEPGVDGVFQIELVVSDGEKASHPWVTNLVVRPKPRPPVAVARAIPREIPSAAPVEQTVQQSQRPVARISGPAAAKMGELILLDAAASRAADGGTLEYLWRQKSGPFVGDIELLRDGTAQRFSPPRAGDYEFELIVAQGGVESDPVTHQIKVVDDLKPPVAVVVAPTRVMPGTLVKLDATQSYDLQGSPLTFRWRQTGGPRITQYLMDEKIGEAAPAFHPSNPGTYSFELIVSNGKLQSKPIEVDIEVGDAAHMLSSLAIDGPEVCYTGTDVTLQAGTGGFSAAGVHFVWRQTSGPEVIIQNNTAGAQLRLQPRRAGRYTFDLTAMEQDRVIATARTALEVFDAAPAELTAQAPVTAPVSVEPFLSAPLSAMAPPAMPQLAPLVDMPPPAAANTSDMQFALEPLPSLAPMQPVQQPQLPMPLPSAGAPRPAAQIHPSSLGGSSSNLGPGVNFLNPLP